MLLIGKSVSVIFNLKVRRRVKVANPGNYIVNWELKAAKSMTETINARPMILG